MEFPTAAARVLRFGIFELDAHSGELRRHGLKIRLPDQAFQILQLLLARPGDVITREELRQQLWTSDTFVDFDLGLNSAIHKLREALGDSADNPQFIQTLPRRGYRFIAPVNRAADDPRSGSVAPSVSPSARLSPKWIAGGLALAVMTAALVVYQRGWWDRVRADAAGAAAGSPAERHPLGRRAIDPAAYDAYLKGVSAAGLQTYEGFRNAVAYFEDAVAKQPDFAMAYANLGQAQLQFLYAGPLSPRETVPKAEAATRKALELDDTLPLAHRTLAGILRNYYWQWEDADKELQRARVLGKHPAEFSAMELIESGQFALAIAQAERARRVDPLSFNAAIDLASAFRAARQYDRAIAEYRSALADHPAQAARTLPARRDLRLHGTLERGDRRARDRRQVVVGELTIRGLSGVCLRRGGPAARRPQRS